MMTLDEGGWRRSKVRIVAPPVSLRGVVEMFWVDEWSSTEAAARTFRVVADDAPHVLWHIAHNGRERTRRLHIVGARAWHHDVDLSGRRLLIAARLRPGALSLFAGTSAAHLTNRSVPLVDVVEKSVARAIRRMNATDPDVGVRELTALLDMLTPHSRAVDERSAWIAELDRTTPTNVDTLGRMLRMPPRTLRAWSVATFGMGLRHFLKIRRLHAALEMRLSGAHDTWSRVSAAAGYADQPHLIRDCRALLGESPTAFVSRAKPTPAGLLKPHHERGNTVRA